MPITPLLKPKDLEGRITLSKKAKKARLLALYASQGGRCYLCGCQMSLLPGELYSAVLEHIQPGKMGGCKDDSDSNTKASCWKCNSRKGSVRL